MMLDLSLIPPAQDALDFVEILKQMNLSVARMVVLSPQKLLDSSNQLKTYQPVPIFLQDLQKF